MATINYTYSVGYENTECETITNARCVAYNGLYLPTLNIKDGDDLEQVLLILDNIFEGLSLRSQAGVIINNVGAGAELYSGFITATHEFRTITSNNNIILTPSAEELNFSISEPWLTSYVSTFGIQWGASMQLKLSELTGKVDDISQLGIDITNLTNSVNNLVFNTGLLQSRLQEVKNVNQSQASAIQQDASDVLNLYGLHFSLRGNFLDLKDGSGNLLSSVDICAGVANCAAQYVFLNNGSAVDVNWNPLGTGSSVTYNITSTKVGIAQPWVVQSKPAWIVTVSGVGTPQVTFNAPQYSV